VGKVTKVSAKYGQFYRIAVRPGVELESVKEVMVLLTNEK
jgi:cell shape-determining protein MreC